MKYAWIEAQREAEAERLAEKLRLADEARKAKAAAPARKASAAVSKRQSAEAKLAELKRRLLDPEGAVVAISSVEFRLLMALVEHPRQVLDRDRLLDLMWDDVGIIRDAASLARADTALTDIEGSLLQTRIPDGDRAFNLTWHDWLNLQSQIEMSKVITSAARQRQKPFTFTSLAPLQHEVLTKLGYPFHKVGTGVLTCACAVHFAGPLKWPSR